MSFSPETVLSPVGFNFGIPLANNPPNPMGPPLFVLLMPLVTTLELLFSLLFKEEELPASPFALTLTTGALLSTVTVFFNVFPALIDWRSKPLSCSPAPEPGALNTGGGGGGGAGILTYLASFPKRQIPLKSTGRSSSQGGTVFETTALCVRSRFTVIERNPRHSKILPSASGSSTMVLSPGMSEYKADRTCIHVKCT